MVDQDIIYNSGTTKDRETNRRKKYEATNGGQSTIEWQAKSRKPLEVRKEHLPQKYGWWEVTC